MEETKTTTKQQLKKKQPAYSKIKQ